MTPRAEHKLFLGVQERTMINCTSHTQQGHVLTLLGPSLVTCRPSHGLSAAVDWRDGWFVHAGATEGRSAPRLRDPIAR